MIKKIEAIIREEKLDEVKEALKAIGIVGMNVFEVQGHGRQGGITLAGRSGTYQIDMLPRIQLNIILSDHNVEKTVKTIKEAARTGERGSDALAYQDDIDSRLAKYYSPPPRRKEETGDTSASAQENPGLLSRLKSRILK